MDSDDLTMDHTEVGARRVVDRYLLGRLEAEEARRFERHYLTCAECLAELETTEQLVGGLRDAAAEDVARTALGAALAARLARRGRIRWLAAGAVFAALAALPSALLYNRLGAIDAELGNTRAALVAARAPQAAVAVLPLNALRDGTATPEGEPSRRIRLGETPGWIVLALELDRPAHARYRVTLRDAAGAELWRGDGLATDAHGTLTLNVHSTTLAAGDHTVEVEKLGEDGTPVPVARFGFHLTAD